MSYVEARKVLLAFSVLAVVCVALAFQGAGVTAVVCIMGTYFCQSIMFPTIFALATKGLAADERKMASSLVIMSIVGGAILPPIAGWLSHMQLSYMLIVPFVCFLFVAYYAASGYRQTAP
jgi:FHS family L-fucose permease-like MFS transporter